MSEMRRNNTKLNLSMAEMEEMAASRRCPELTFVH